MDAGAEGQLTVRLPVNVQLFGIVELTGIAVGGGKSAKEHLDAGDPLAV